MIRAALLCLVCATPGAAQQQTSLAAGAILRGLDKVSGRTTDIEIEAGASRQYGRLTITLTECRFPEGNRAGDAYAGLQILEQDVSEPVFNGWMVASAPALSAMDHSRYDVWVIRCTTS